MKNNLVEELGVNYFTDRFNQAVFLDKDGRPAMVTRDRGSIEDGINVQVFTGEPVTGGSVVDSAPAKVPFSFFSSLKVFAVPPLGWRMSRDGSWLTYMSRANNHRRYYRGVTMDNLSQTAAPTSEFLMETGNISRKVVKSVPYAASLLMRPYYLPLRDGLAAMERGDIFSFAVSATIAVIPAAGGKRDILFNTRKVAEVSKDGEVSCINPMVETLIQDAA